MKISRSIYSYISPFEIKQSLYYLKLRIYSIKAINVGVKIQKYEDCQKEFVGKYDKSSTTEKALDAESMLGSAPAPLFENFSRGVRFLILFRMLGFGLIPRNFRILGARIRKYCIIILEYISQSHILLAVIF